MHRSIHHFDRSAEDVTRAALGHDELGLRLVPLDLPRVRSSSSYITRFMPASRHDVISGPMGFMIAGARRLLIVVQQKEHVK
jgi:hypothetical protein